MCFRSPLLGIGTLGLLEGVKEDSSHDIELVALLDDVAISGRPEPVLSAFELLESRVQSRGMQIQRDKVKCYCQRAETLNLRSNRSLTSCSCGRCKVLSLSSVQWSATTLTLFHVGEQQG